MIQPAQTLLLLVFLGVALTACTSAEQRYEQGQALEDAGQASRAAHRYVQALRKDPTLSEARSRLEVAGRDAVAAHLRQAEQDRRRGDAVARADSLLAAEGVLLAARSVQVTLAVPPGFAASRRAALDGAIEQLHGDAASLSSQARWADALKRLDETARFDPSPAQTHALTRTRLSALAAWSGAELAAGHYRTAMDIAQQGIEASAPGDRLRHTLQSIHHDAVQQASVVVAFLPVAGGDGSAESRAFLAAVNDDLELEHWLEHPPLIVALDPRSVRLEAGRRGRVLNARQAVRIGRRLRADFVVLSVLQDFTLEESSVRERSRQAKTRLGKPVRYTERSGRKQLRATTSFRVFPVSGKRNPPSHRVTASHSARFTDARYKGDHRNLKLPPGQARAFAHARGDDKAREQLAEKLASKLARRMFDKILERIP